VCAVPEPNQSVLIKFENLKTGRELFRTQLPWTAHKDGDYFIAVDASANPVRLWIPSLGGYCPFGLKCLEDAGDKFVDLGDPRPQSEVVTAQGMRDLSVDRLRGELYVKSNPERWHRIDDRTGEVLAEIKFKGFHMANHATQLVACKDGSLVTLMWAENWMKRWTRDGAPLNWEGSDSNLATGGLRGIMTYTQKYLAVHGDEIYQVMRTGDKKYSSVNVYGMDGKPRRTAIWQCSIDAVPRLDARGNIFLGANVRPQGRAWPEFFDAALGPLPDRMNYGSVYWYSYMYGSVVKFPSSGGAVWFDQKASTTAIGEPPADLQARPRLAVGRHRDFDPSHKIALQGAEWYRFGFSPAHQYQSAGGPTCMCEGAGFDVDNYGRVFYPNLGRFRVEVIDNNNNVIGTFGRYGSEDSLGAGRAAEGAIRDPDSRISHPDIPLAWPTYVAVSDTYAYVNDILSRRVVRVRLGWTAEETCVLD
jgi:hypothetical protein